MPAPSTDRRQLDDDDLALLGLPAQGLSTEAIARRLDASRRTVRRRSRTTSDRLGVPAPTSAVARATRQGLL